MSRFRPVLKINHDFLGGCLLIVIAVAAYVLGQSYAVGTLNRMGPGYLPAALSIILGAMGVILAIAAQFQPAEAPEIRLRPLLAVAAALVVFAFLLRPAGLLPAAFVCVLLGSLADDKITWPGRLVLGVAVALFSGGVFVLGLGMNVPLWRL
ncbi:MAG: tripartite tricarboxylate transporter TctB family protein [Alkalilacustris sp.]